MKIFITADHHFHHKNIIEYCNRSFKTVEEMDNVTIEKWNKKVGRDDLVIHLGDFALGTKEQVKETKEKLNGTIILIKGNHDRVNEGFIVVRDSIQIGNLLFSHRPIPKKEIPKGCINESEKSDELTISTSKTEILFLELMYNCLSIGGKCSVIVPDGVLFGNSNAHKSIRKLLLEKCRLDAIISMPSGIFKPYAGVSTAVLFFTKGEPTEKVWFYDMEADGFSLDDKRNEIQQNDIPDILERFEKRSKEDNKDISKKSFFVSIDEIKANEWDLSINKYRKENHEEVIHRESKEIIKEAKKEVKELLEGFEELEKIV